jgi:hypothetical protein
MVGCSGNQGPDYDAECLALDAGVSGGGCGEWEAAIRSKCDGGLSNGDAGQVTAKWDLDGVWACDEFETFNCSPAHSGGFVCSTSSAACTTALNATTSCAAALSTSCSLVCVN